MTLMKGAPLPAFNGTVRASLRKAAIDVLAVHGVSAAVESQKTRRGFVIDGPFFSGKQIGNSALTLYFCVFLDASFAEFLNVNDPTPESRRDSKLSPLDVAAFLCERISVEAGKSFPEWHKEWTSGKTQDSSEQSSVRSQHMPEEWLVTPVSCAQGRLEVLFAYQGDWAVTDGEPDESLTEARDMTFF